MEILELRTFLKERGYLFLANVGILDGMGWWRQNWISVEELALPKFMAQ